MSKPKVRKVQAGYVAVMATVSGEEKTVATIKAATVKSIQKGASLVVKGGDHLAMGINLIATAMVRVIELKGGKVLKGASLKAARRAVRTIIQEQVPEAYGRITETVENAIADLTGLLVKVNQHAHRCLDHGQVLDGVSVGARRFKDHVKAGLRIDHVIASQLTASLGGARQWDADREDVAQDVVRRQEGLLIAVCDLMDERGDLNGRKTRATFKEYRETWMLIGNQKAGGQVPGDPGKVRPTVGQALEGAAGSLNNVNLKDQGATDAQTHVMIGGLLRHLIKIANGAGTCAAQGKNKALAEDLVKVLTVAA